MDAASMEQMNKLRKSLGLPLLSAPNAAPPSQSGPSFKAHDSDSSGDDEPASTLETREAAGYGNWQQLQDEAEAKKRREAKVAALKKARDLSQRFSKLEGKGLGDLDDDGDIDAKSWLKTQKKRMMKIEKERAERTAKELEERERLADIEYKSSDLVGVNVAHEIGDFEEGEGEQILTLKDKTIGGEDDEDELEAAEIVARDNLAKRLDLKKKKAAYDVHADNEDGERKILGQYDEDTDRKRKFTLDASGSNAEAREAKRRAVGDLLQSSKSMISLAPLESENLPISDYMTEVKIRKPRKDKKKKREKVIDDDDIFPAANGREGDSMDVDSNTQNTKSKSNGSGDTVQDDEDLQLALAQSRRAAFKKKKRVRPEDLAKELRATSPSTPDAGDDNEDGLVFDETTAFVENLQVTRQEAKSARVNQKFEEPAQNAASPEDDDGDVHMEQSYNDVEDGEDLAARVKDEKPASNGQTTTGLEDEATLDQGAGATLRLLKQRGLVNSDDNHELTEIQRQREFFLQERRNREAASEAQARSQREQDRKAGTYDRMSTKDRQQQAQYENSRREQQDQRQMAQFFDANYRPNVELKYVDDSGRTLDRKEAFKHLSHMFHGKGSGKQKTEKRLKKIDDEKKKESVSVLDSSQSVGMDRAQGAVGKKNKQAGVRLG